MIDYNAIINTVETQLRAGTYTDTIKEYLVEGMERDFLLGNMPFINIRLDGGNIQPRSLPNGYYALVGLKIDIASFDFSLFKKAAIQRNRILQEVQLQLQTNRTFGGAVETSSIGPQVEFSSGIVEGDDNTVRGHIASATFDLVVEVFVEATQ